MGDHRPFPGPLTVGHAGMLLVAVFLFGCIPSVTVPIETVRYPSHTMNPAGRVLIVYLPGNGDPVGAFEREGLLAALNRSDVPADVVSVNAHLGYYLNNSVVERLDADLIAPARKAGYERIWLVGNSLGGFGSLLYARERPGTVTGIVLLGPFLGERSLVREISRNGLHQWDPGAFDLRSKEGQERLLWTWIRDCTRTGTCPLIYLGYGTHDRFAPAQAELASHLARERVIALSGGHDWSVWKLIWERLLEQDILTRWNEEH